MSSLLKAIGLLQAGSGAHKAASGSLAKAQALFKSLRIDEGEAASWVAVAHIQQDDRAVHVQTKFDALKKANRLYGRMGHLEAQVFLLRELGSLCTVLPNRSDEAQTFLVESRRIRGEINRRSNNPTTGRLESLLPLAVTVPGPMPSMRPPSMPM